jgi:hypothetical protein
VTTTEHRLARERKKLETARQRLIGTAYLS